MKIASANLHMASAHASQQQHEIRESLNVWVGQRRPVSGSETSQPRAEIVTLSDAGQAANAASTEGSEDSAVDNDPKLALIRSIMEMLTGQRINIFDTSELQPNNSASSAATAPSVPPTNTTPADYGIEYDYHASYTEVEQTTFSASGTIKTADGQEISFQLELNMTRMYHEESNISLRFGDAARKTDPLVLNFAGTAAQLTDQRFSFDLNADGNNEQINFVAPGSGFLVFDRNQDGKINNGSELFGPTTGNGFQELAKLDDDNNGWIDENDAAFGQLKLWSQNPEGQSTLSSLAESGVGAIALASSTTPFDLKTAANELLGQIRNSGIFLQEDGSTGTIQQIDLTA